MSILSMNQIHGFRPDVVIVGAGPWGTLFAKRVKRVYEKKYSQPLNVLILEKRLNATPRNNTLSIDSGTLKQHPDIRRVVNARNEVKIVDLEQHLRKCAQKAGVLIAHQEVIDPKILEQQFPMACLMVGADGANSLVRTQVFAEPVQKTILKRVVQIRYQAHNTESRKKLAKLTLFSAKYKTMKMVDRVIEEHVGREYVTTRFFVSEEEFKIMEAAKSATPYRLNEGRKAWMHSKLHKDILRYLKARACKGEIRPSSSLVEVTAYPLAITRARRFVKLESGKPAWILGGDSAMNFAFWKSFNVACKIMPQLASLSAEHMDAVKKERPNLSPLTRFQKIADRQFWWSSQVTRLIDLVVTLWAKFIYVSGRVPWQINKWSDQQIREFSA